MRLPEGAGRPGASQPHRPHRAGADLLRGPGLTGDDLQGNICKGFQATNSGKTFTLYMREGMKWSDGEPLTTADIRFAYEDVLLNEDVTSGVPSWALISGSRISPIASPTLTLSKLT